MLREDFFIQTNIRRVLIRSNIDYSQITFGTVRGIVYVQGTFKVYGISSNVSSRDNQEIAVKTLRSLEMKIKSIPGVVDVKFQLQNWKKEKGQWSPTKVVE
jgi:hypothetical protein